MDLLTVNQEKCLRCGICVECCPSCILSMGENGPECNFDRGCMSCGQCVAICPVGALDNKYTPLAEQRPVTMPLPTPEVAYEFLRMRRSVRNFKPQTPTDEEITRMLDVARYAPTAGNSQGMYYIVIRDKEQIRAIADAVADWMEAEVEAKIEAYIDGEIDEIPLATKESIGRTVDYPAGRNRYIGHLISIPCHDFKNIKVGLDCSNGSSSAIAKSVFDALRAKTYVINNEPNGTNINRGCGSTHIEVLRQFVVDKGLDIGFAYDGDADRCIAVDHRGNIIDGDKIMYVCGKYLKEKGQLNGDTIVTTIMSNLGLYKACDRAGIPYEKTAVGDKNECDNMKANGYSLR